MKFNSQDIAVIEYALQSALQNEKSKVRIAELREVLDKLRENAWIALQVNADSETSDDEKLRYDYDDLVESI